MQRALLLFALLSPAAAFAEDAVATESPNQQFASFLPLILIFGIFYFLLIRPQQKKMKEHQSMLTELKKGDEIVTGGGVLGKITKVDAGDTFTVEIAKGVEIQVLKSTVSTARGKEVAAPAAPEKKKSGSKNNDNRVPSRDSVANDN